MIGVSCPGFSATPVAEWAGPISEHFRLWEIFSEADHIVYRDTPAIKGILDSAGLARQVHSPICDWNIAALSDRLREASLKETVAVRGVPKRGPMVAWIRTMNTRAKPAPSAKAIFVALAPRTESFNHSKIAELKMLNINRPFLQKSAEMSDCSQISVRKSAHSSGHSMVAIATKTSSADSAKFLIFCPTQAVMNSLRKPFTRS